MSGNERGLDLAVILGLGAGAALIAAAIVVGGSPLAFVDGPSALIVVGGTAAVTTISFSLGDVATAIRLTAGLLFQSGREPPEVARRLLAYCAQARRDGLMALQPAIGGIRGEPVLRAAMQMLLEGTAVDEVERTMRRDLAARAGAQMKAAAVLRRASEVAPSMGLIGTLIGLVEMLGNLNNPSAIGPGMAVALLTTFYGAVLGFMILGPLASKLENNADAETLLHHLYLVGATAIGRLETPRRLETLLNSLLPPAMRVDYVE